MSISMAHEAGNWTLTEAARLLGEPQHRLIYLCEKGVVEPDLQDAEGRGSSRRFSSRNLLEFAVALRLRDLELPATLIGAVVHVLRAFEGAVGREIRGFHLPESLRATSAPDLLLVIGDGRRLYFTLGARDGPPKVYGGIDLNRLKEPKSAGRSRPKLRLVKPATPAAGATCASDFGGPEGSRHTRVEISVTQIAQDLPLDA
jgi:DNA-binding transcriptional MerR regulator